MLVGAALLGFGAVLLTAIGTAQPGPALGAGGLVELTVAAGGLMLALRRTRIRRMASVGGAVVLVALSALAVLVPLPAEAPRAVPVPSQAYWQLPSGSHIRYVHRAPVSGPPQTAAVVFLHGGPGVADLAGDSAFFGSLAADGFDVYVYDELGAGGSSRLADPTGYGVTRDDPQSAAAPASDDIRPKLAGLPTPTLLVKGSCDYLSWHSAIDYSNALPHSTLIYLRGAGTPSTRTGPKRYSHYCARTSPARR